VCPVAEAYRIAGQWADDRDTPLGFVLRVAKNIEAENVGFIVRSVANAKLCGIIA
jgi:hypothetical protein